MWAHWTAQCVPEQGDWYARKMYQEGSPDYKYQCEHYGHPSKFGFKDIDNLWHAEKWAPEHLMDLYHAAGARFFMALGNHHDNFDTWNSKYQPWNAVNIGPKKDIVAGWSKAARARGMKFGVTLHAARNWTWFEVAQGADKQGPLAGVPYDGNMTKAAGAGLWWDGYDPQDLYSQNHPIGAPPSKVYCDKFYNRVIDLIDSYSPDLVYFDDGILPLNHADPAYGLKIAAHLYNTSAKLNNGTVQAIMTTKGLSGDQLKCLTWDIERGITDDIEPIPWQSETCIGDWHYNINVLNRHSYKTPELVVHMLCDIVSKNGTFLLNIPLPGNGMPDADELAFLGEMAKWIKVNGDAIYGTRPWAVYGEGPSVVATTAAKSNKTSFNEGHQTPLTAQDFRFTTKNGALYAIAQGWPRTGTATVTSLATGTTLTKGDVKRVELLGVNTPLKFTRDASGLATMPYRSKSKAPASWHSTSTTDSHFCRPQPVCGRQCIMRLIAPTGPGW
jgi:alpha-L-fucosidase